MFTVHVNTACKQIVENTHMNESAERLFSAILHITKGKVDGFASPGAVAKYLNVGAAVVTNWKKRGVSKDGQLEVNAKTGINPNWLATGEGEMLPSHEGRVDGNVEDAPALRKSKGVPVIGEVQGGDDGYLDELQYPVGHGEGFVEYWCRDNSAYALRVRGESMHPRYRHGEFIVVTPAIEALPGRDVVVQLRDGRKMLKQLNWIRGGEVQLLSINNHFGPLTFSLSEVASIQRVAGSVGSDALI